MQKCIKSIKSIKTYKNLRIFIIRYSLAFIVIVLFYLYVFLYGVGSFICYFYVGLLEYVGYFPHFISEVCKCCGPFALVLFLAVLVCCVTFV
jgi:hypothetical protein